MKRMVALLIMAALLGCMCPLASAEEAHTSLVIADVSEWWGLDVGQLDGTSYTQALTTEPLIVLDADGTLQPCIASAVSMSEDGLTLTMTFDEGMYFANGNTLDPEDVVASIERLQEISPFSSQFSTIESMEISGRDVIFHLSTYAADLTNALASSWVNILDTSEIESKTADELLWDCTPYGLYSVKEYVQGSHVVLARNEGFVTHNPHVENKGPAAVEEVTVRFISEEFTMAQEANLGNIDIIMNISANGADQITREDMVKTHLLANPNINYLEFNLTDSVMSDINIRKAIALAIDRDELCALCDNTIVPAYSYVTDHVFNHNADWAAYYQENFCNDVEAAKALLAESGWSDTDGDGIVDKDGVPLVLHTVTSNIQSPDALVAQGLQIQLMNIGVYLDLDMQEDSYHYDTLINGDFQVGTSRFGCDEPIMLLQWALNYYDSLDVTCGQDAFFAAIDEIAATPDYATRTEMVYGVEQMLGEDVVIVPLYTSLINYVCAQDVTGPTFMGNGRVYFNDMK